MSNRRALVIGGSLGGLIVAHLLRTTGWDAVVFERNEEELASRGVGLGTHPQLIGILKRAGVDFDDTMGITPTRAVCLDRNGEIVIERPTGRTLSGWSRLYRALLDALPAPNHRLGKRLVRVAQDADSATAFFADGSSERGDLLVGADGIRSAVRAQFLPDVEPHYAGYVAWRASIDEADVPAELWAEMVGLYAFCLPEGEQVISYAVPGRDNDTAVGRRAYNIVWYRPADRAALADMCTDAQGRHHAAGIPPPLIRPDVVARVKADARAHIAPQIAEIFTRSAPFFQPIYDLASPQIVFGRVVLAGDAAFVARPHAGAGTTKAALDAACLADSIRGAGGDLARGLQRYQRMQLPFGRALVEVNSAEGAYLSAQIKPKGERTADELHRDIGAVVNAHIGRSEQVGEMVAAYGLDVHVNVPA
jgi:2-polyprenyl-6-methoxyphenol hydroxylase-like FAD-dependent oxidoreductase